MEEDDFLKRFCFPDSDRFALLREALQALGVHHKTVSLGRHRHLLVEPLVRSRPNARPVVLVAHYDRYPGSPGANDNASSVLHLLLLLERMKMLGERALWPEVWVVFTDGEELTDQSAFTEQGSYGLGQIFKRTRLARAFYLVLDLTGIGDTVVLGKNILSHLERRGMSVDQGQWALLCAQRLIAKKVLTTLRKGSFLEVETPFSDDLGLLMAGIVSTQISLLPREEAEGLRRGKIQGTPPSWSKIHSPEDRVETLWKSSREVMAEVLDVFLAYPLPSV